VKSDRQPPRSGQPLRPNGAWDGFPKGEIERLSGCLRRLVPHLRRDEIAITGGVAIQIGLAASGRSDWRKTIADLDLVASSLDAVSSGVAGPFLVSHYHVAQAEVPKFMIQLVDPVSRIRVDIFPDLVGSLKRTERARIGRHTMNRLSLRDIFEHKLQTLSKASPDRPVDPKHDRDARALGAVLGAEVPTVMPDALVHDVFTTEADSSCRRCALSTTALFPLAPKDRIAELLGWPLVVSDDPCA